MGEFVRFKWLCFWRRRIIWARRFVKSLGELLQLSFTANEREICAIMRVRLEREAALTTPEVKP